MCVFVYAFAFGQCVESVEANGKVGFCPDPHPTVSSKPPPAPEPSVSPPAPEPSVSPPAPEPSVAPAAPEPSVAPAVSDISGAWIGAYGLSYDVQQDGTQLVIQEHGLYGVITATGHGQITGTSVHLSWQALNGVTGVVNLTLGSGGQHLQGTITSTYSGTAVFALSR